MRTYELGRTSGRPGLCIGITRADAERLLAGEGIRFLAEIDGQPYDIGLIAHETDEDLDRLYAETHRPGRHRAKDAS